MRGHSSTDKRVISERHFLVFFFCLYEIYRCGYAERNMGNGQSQHHPDKASLPGIVPTEDGAVVVHTTSPPTQNEDGGQLDDLPQRKMGEKEVDDMCFMIVCTNWY